MRLRWSGTLPTIARSAEVALPAADVYAGFRDQGEPESTAIVLVADDPPRSLEWSLTLRGLRGARLRVELDPVGQAVTRVTTRLDARIVGRLRLRRSQLVHDYTIVLSAILDRALRRMSEPAAERVEDESELGEVGPGPAAAG